MYPTVTSFRPPSGMRCDSRLLSSFITGALTATTVTLFLLRIVPGTYVVLPCDPTITVRPVLMEEYLDRIDVQQEVFPDDSVIDNEPIHIPAVADAGALKHKKLLHPEKHRNQRKKNLQKGPKKNNQKQYSKSNSSNAKVNSEGPKDLQHQLKELQEKEDKEKGLKIVPAPLEEKHHSQQKRKYLQEQRQVKQHLKEIQLHLQQEVETMNQKRNKGDRIVRDQRKGMRGVKELALQSSQHRSTLAQGKQQEDNSRNTNEISNPMKEKQVSGRVKRESYQQNTTSRQGKVGNSRLHPKVPDSKLIQAIMPHQVDENSQLHRSVSSQKSDRSKEKRSAEDSADAKKDHQVTNITVPKLSRIMPRN